MSPDEQQYWFQRLTARIWLPIAWQGWLLLAGLIGGLLVILAANGLSGQESIDLEHHWPILVEIGALAIAFYWFCRGRVRR